jgi:hypothetical protein
MYLKYIVDKREVIENIVFENPVESYERINFTFDLNTFMTLEIYYDYPQQTKTFYMATFHYPDGFCNYMHIEPKTLQIIKPTTAFYRPFNDSRGKQQETKEIFSSISALSVLVLMQDSVVKSLNFKIN